MPQVPAGAVYVGRAAGPLPASPYANPYPVARWGQGSALRLYRDHLARNPALAAAARRELAGRDLACWCQPGQPCHADILLHIAAGCTDPQEDTTMTPPLPAACSLADPCHDPACRACYPELAPADSPPGTVLLNAARWCAGRGWPVFPLRPAGKRPAFPGHKAEECTGTDPRCRGGHQGWEPRATTDPDRIGRAWAAAPYNVGIACGPAELLVIDLDQPKPGEIPPPEWALPGITDGADVLAALCERHGQPWPGETFTVRTRRGGLHLYFTAPPGARLGNTAGEHGRGLGWLIDTRGHGGYVVAPGSFVDLPDGTGSYKVVYDRPPAPLPEWLYGLLTPPPAENPPAECRPAGPDQVRDLDRYTATALSSEMERVRAAAEGGRNHALNKAAFHLGQLITAGALPEHLAHAELYQAASVHFGAGTPPFTPAYARSVIAAGIAAGKRKPRPLATLGTAA
jgi:hypothetical protein